MLVNYHVLVYHQGRGYYHSSQNETSVCSHCCCISTSVIRMILGHKVYLCDLQTTDLDPLFTHVTFKFFDAILTCVVLESLLSFLSVSFSLMLLAECFKGFVNHLASF